MVDPLVALVLQIPGDLHTIRDLVHMILVAHRLHMIPGPPPAALIDVG